MANYWVDSTLSTGGNDGTSPASAWRGNVAIKTGFENTSSVTSGDTVWFRRTSVYDGSSAGQNADIYVHDRNNTYAAPQRYISWPRGIISDSTITEATWNIDGNHVEDVVGLTLSKRAHEARWCTAPNGKKYFIISVDSNSTFYIDRYYDGTSVSGTGGKFQIDADRYYAERPQAGIDAGWDSDPHELPLIDFNNEDYGSRFISVLALIISGFAITDTIDTLTYAVYSHIIFQNMLFYDALNNGLVRFNYSTITLDEFTVIGSGSGGESESGLICYYGNYILKNGSIGNMQSIGMLISGNTFLENVSVGKVYGNGGVDLFVDGGAIVKGIDVAIGGSNGYISTSEGYKQCSFENFDKTLGNHYSFYPKLGVGKSLDVLETNANKKLSDTILEISPNSLNLSTIAQQDWEQELFDGEFLFNAGSHSVKFWIYNDTTATLNDASATDNIYLEATYCDSYSSVGRYTMQKAYSTQVDISQAASADDWDYLQVNFSLPVASKAHIKMFMSFYDASNKVLIDPQPVVS